MLLLSRWSIPVSRSIRRGLLTESDRSLLDNFCRQGDVPLPDHQVQPVAARGHEHAQLTEVLTPHRVPDEFGPHPPRLPIVRPDGSERQPVGTTSRCGRDDMTPQQPPPQPRVLRIARLEDPLSYRASAPDEPPSPTIAAPALVGGGYLHNVHGLPPS